jgi:hypothetical protein
MSGHHDGSNGSQAAYEGVDTIVLFEELACGDALPTTWQPLAAPLDPLEITSMAEQNQRLLLTCTALEEHAAGEKSEEGSVHGHELARLELKVNLLLEVVGQLVAQQRPRPPAVPIRFNAVGAAWRAVGPLPRPRERGVLEIHLQRDLVQPLRMLGEIVSVGSDSLVKVRFEPPGDAVADLVEKLAFRRHRRQVAGARHPRRAAG